MLFKMQMHLNCQDRFFRLPVNPCGSQQPPQVFLGDVYGISKQLEKIVVGILDNILKAKGKTFDPFLYCLLKDFNILRGDLSYTSPRNR